MKKFFTCILSAALMSSVFTAYATETFVNSGIIELSGEVNDALLGDVLTVNVVKSDFDWDTESVWENENYIENSENIKFYDIAETDANGRYYVRFMLDEMGEYTAYFGSEYLENPIIRNFRYTNAEERDAVVSALNSAASAEETAQFLKDNRYALMLYSDKYDEADLDEAGRLLYDYLASKDELSADEMTDAVYMSLMVNFINTRDIENMADYSDCLGISGSSAGKYWSDSYGTTVAGKIESETVETIADYDEKMFYMVSGCIISKNDGTAGIKAVLKEHMERTGSDKTVTNAMCSKIAGESLYTKAELEEWIENYVPASGGSSGGGGGSSSGGGSSGGGGGSSSGGGYKTEHYEGADTSLGAGIEAPEKDENTVSAIGSVFVDIENVKWAKAAIEALYEKGIVAGRNSRTFEPYGTVLREEFVKMLMMTFNLNIVGEDLKFTDTDKNGWYYKYVNCAYNTGIVKGCSDELFGIGQNITRQDLCVMIDNALKVCEISPDESAEKINFTDENEIADYAKDAVIRMQKIGAVSGYTDGSFKPYGTATRAEAAKIIYMISQYAMQGR